MMKSERQSNKYHWLLPLCFLLGACQSTISDTPKVAITETQSTLPASPSPSVTPATGESPPSWRSFHVAEEQQSVGSANYHEFLDEPSMKSTW